MKTSASAPALQHRGLLKLCLCQSRVCERLSASHLRIPRGFAESLLRSGLDFGDGFWPVRFMTCRSILRYTAARTGHSRERQHGALQHTQPPLPPSTKKCVGRAGFEFLSHDEQFRRLSPPGEPSITVVRRGTPARNGAWWWRSRLKREPPIRSCDICVPGKSPPPGLGRNPLLRYSRFWPATPGTAALGQRTFQDKDSSCSDACRVL